MKLSYYSLLLLVPAEILASIQARPAQPDGRLLVLNNNNKVDNKLENWKYGNNETWLSYEEAA